MHTLPTSRGVYLLHFDQKISGHAGHYLGYADNIAARLATHQAGGGARLTAVAKERGIGFTLVRIWADMGRQGERRLKKRKHGDRLCPICNPTKHTKAAAWPPAEEDQTK